MRLPVNHALPLAALLLAGGYGPAQARPATSLAPAAAPTGPAADYPVTVGDPYTIDGTTWTPADQLNYDAVGYASVSDTLTGVTAAHKTLPLPSYAEVTALDTGRTILVRLVERGPRDNDRLVALSAAAAAQLGITPGPHAAVRVRRVNPPEIERAALRTGSTAPVRMETPESLLKVLRRKLADQSPLMPPPSLPPTMPTSVAADVALPTASPARVPKRSSAATAARPGAASYLPKTAALQSPAPTSGPNLPPAKAPAPAAKGTHVVQVAAFSSHDNAQKAARQLGGIVSPAGRLWRVRLGPFPVGKEASSALEKAKAAGYSDARIQRAD